MKRRGRPSLPKSQVKSVTVCTRTDQRTFKLYKRAAQMCGVGLTDWIRLRLHTAAERDLAT